MNRKTGKKPSLMQAFTLSSLMILLVSLSITGWWVSRQITSQVITRVGHTTSMFAGSVIAPYVLEILDGDGGMVDFESMMARSSLGTDIVALKVWGRGGLILYSTDPTEIGGVFPVEAGLENAWKGIVSAEMSNLDREEHEQQRKIAEKLLETYSPIREPGTGKIVAVVEFYQSVDVFLRELRTARLQSWLIVTAVVLMIYLSLVVVVRRGSRTILRQRDELENRLHEYQRLLTANTELQSRINAAAVRTTALNERFLRRVAAELHDGPAQDIGYSLLMMDSVGGSGDCPSREDTKKALKRALGGIRDVSAGLRSPDLEQLAIGDIVERAARIHASRAKGSPRIEISDVPDHVGIAVKITVFRVVQEALSNAFKHANDESPEVTVCVEDDHIVVKVRDHGDGIAKDMKKNQGMGLSIMHERVQLLGGTFRIQSSRTDGTTVTAIIPLLSQEEDDG